MLVVRCPSCGHDMRYQPQGGLVSEKKKRCVYCGCTFMVHSALPKSRIVDVETERKTTPVRDSHETKK